jgi:hypothetical protein
MTEYLAFFSLDGFRVEAYRIRRAWVDVPHDLVLHHRFTGGLSGGT